MPGVGGWVGWVGWLETDNRAISVQLNLTGTATGTELGKMAVDPIFCSGGLIFCWIDLMPG